MKRTMEKNVYTVSNIIEYFIATLIITVIVILSIDLIRFILDNVLVNPAEEAFTGFLQRALNLVIGVEFVKMLCNHRPETIIEVLLFAISRQMIVEHLGVSDIFVGVVSIAVLFATRKFLFINYEKKVE